MAEPDYTIPQIDQIMRGIAIIRKYETDPYPVAAEHDILYCGSYETRERMTEEEREQMNTYGWHEVDDSWGFIHNRARVVCPPALSGHAGKASDAHGGV